MTLEQARRILGVEAETSDEEVREVFDLCWQRMESRVRRAQSPSLKQKYQGMMAEMEEAWEVIGRATYSAGLLKEPRSSPELEAAHDAGRTERRHATGQNRASFQRVNDDQDVAGWFEAPVYTEGPAGLGTPRRREVSRRILIGIGLVLFAAACGWTAYYYEAVLPVKKTIEAKAEVEKQAREEDARLAVLQKAKEEEIRKQQAEERSRAEGLRKLAQQKEEEENRLLGALPQTQNVPDEYATIQAAIDAAKAGDTVLLKPGIYHEALKFKEGIELRGESPETTIVRFSTSATALAGQDHYDSPLEVRNCQNGSVRNISFEQDAKDERTDLNAWKADAIELIDSTITVENCRAQSAAGSGIYVDGLKSEPTLSRNQCRANQLDGISFMHGAQGKAEGNVCEQNKADGIRVADSGASPRLAENQCRANEHYGIEFFYGAQGKAERNACEQNLWSGIAVVGSGTAPELSKNQCPSNKQHGILFTHGAQGTAESNVCEQNTGNGIGVCDSGTSPALINNECRRNEQNGIGFWNGARGKADGNICEENADQGILVTGPKTAPQITNTQSRGNRKAGIYFSSGASGRAQQNLCGNNAWSGIVVNASSPFLSGNRLEENAEYGIMYGPPAKPLFGPGNVCAGNSKGDVLANAKFNN
jgi:hypothetical protein